VGNFLDNFDSAVSDCRSFLVSTSIRNRLPGTIEKIISDKVVSELLIRTAAGNVTSIITTGSVRRMNLKEGDSVFALIKATEVSIEKESSAGN
jgi:molybdopterin-binding protein